MRQHVNVAVPRSGTADAVMAAGMIRAGGGVCACRRPVGMPMLCGAITANARGCDAGTPVWSVRAGTTGVSGGSWRWVEGVPRGAGCAPPAAWPVPGRWHTRRSGSIGSAQPHRGVAPHTTPHGHAPAVCTVAGGGTTTHRPSARAGGRASRRAASQRARLEPQSARVRPHICSMPPPHSRHTAPPHACAGRWRRGVAPPARCMPCGVRVVWLHTHVPTAARMPDLVVRGCTRWRRPWTREPPASDSEGIRTPAGRAQWISSPSP